MSLEAFTSQLEEEILDPEEETFLLFTQPFPSHNLGFIDPGAHIIDISINEREYTIHQSPAVLSSSRAGGTTGAVLWKITPLFASFLSSPKNPLFTTNTLTSISAVLELGCGISPLNALAVSPHIASYTLTDQPYVQRLITQNITENLPTPGKNKKGTGGSVKKGDIKFRILDWEHDQLTLSWGNFDVVVCCDCVYNEALVSPLVQTCVDACRLRGEGERQTVCIVAQQLRSHEVCESWLKEFHKSFHVWRLPDHFLPEGLRSDDGFAIHVGILRS